MRIGLYMKSKLLVLMLFMFSLSVMPQTQQEGVAYQYRDGQERTPLGNVTISYDDNKRSVLSNEKDGSFRLFLPHLEMGEQIGNVTVKKKGMIVFNQDAVNEWSVRKEPLKLILCDIKEFMKRKNRIFKSLMASRSDPDTGRSPYHSQIGSLSDAAGRPEKGEENEHEQRSREIEELFKRIESIHGDVSERTQLFGRAMCQTFEKQSQEMSIREYVEQLARIDESEIDDYAQIVLREFYKGSYRVTPIVKARSAKYPRDLDSILNLLHKRPQHPQLLAEKDKLINSIKAQILVLLLMENGALADRLLKQLCGKINSVEENKRFAYICGSRNMPDTSIKYYKHALELLENNKCEGSVSCLINKGSIQMNLALLFKKQRRMEESNLMFTNTLESYQELLSCQSGKCDVEIAKVMYYLGLVKKELKKNDQAIHYFEKSSGMFKCLSNDEQIEQQWYYPSLYWLDKIYGEENNNVSSYQTCKKYLHYMKQQYEADTIMMQNLYANKLGSQSFCAIFAKQFTESERYAREGLVVDSTMHFIYTNLAAALLLQGKYDEAEKIYRQYKDELKDSFLDDFRQFAEAGVIPKEREADVERIKRMLEE